MTKIIEIVVSPTGQTTVQTTGFVGASCQDASRFNQRTEPRGRRWTGEHLTAEFHQSQGTEQVIREGQ